MYNKNINHGDQATRQGHIKPPIPWSAGRRNLHTRRTMGAMGERKIVRQEREREREREREIGRETGMGEREGRKRKNYKHKNIHGILSSRTSLRRTE